MEQKMKRVQGLDYSSVKNLWKNMVEESGLKVKRGEGVLSNFFFLKR